MITIGESNINDFYFDITSNLNYDITSLFGGNNLNIKDVKTTSQSTLILTNDCNVYGWGVNQYGELGLGNTTSITELTHITSNITKIDCGQNHSLFLDLDGIVHSCGKNNLGQLGLSNYTDINTLSNINLDNIEDISVGNDISLFKDTNDDLYFCGILKNEASNIQIDCGYEHTMFLTSLGNIYGCGRNHKNQVSSSSTDPITQPTEITDFLPPLVNDKITQIACGNYHTMFLTSNEKVYGCGHNNVNQVKSSNTDPITQPTEITNFLPSLVDDKIIEITCGGYHTMFLTSLGNIYGCGGNSFNQVNSSDTNPITQPTKITDFPELESGDKITQIACGWSHTMFLTSLGKVYGCGENGRFQVNSSRVADGNGYYYVQTPTEITDFPQLEPDDKITQIACGNNHTMFLTSHGKVYGCGENEYFQVDSTREFLYDNYVVQTPTEITEFDDLLEPDDKIIEIACGGYHTMFLTSQGNIYGCGRNHKNQINSSSTDPITQPTEITDIPETVEIIQIACGNEYTFFLTSLGNVYGCGRNNKNQVSEISDVDDKVINIKKIDIYNEEIENIPKFIASNVRKILADNDFIYYVTNYNDIYKNNDLILGNSTFTDININDHKMYILNDINRLNDVDTTNIVPIIPQSDIQPQPIAGTTDYKTLTFTYDTKYPKIDDDSTNLILQWKFDDADNLNYDSVSETNKGTLSSGVLSTTGQIETAIDFHKDGKNLSYDIPTSLINFQNTSHSFTFWFNFNSAEDTYGRLIELYNDRFQILGAQEPGKGRVRLSYAFNASSIENDDIIDLNQWYHFAVIVDIVTLDFKLYKNGVSVSIADFDVSITNTAELRQRITFGKMYASHITTRDADGQIDDFRIYNKALSIDEITDLYNQYSQTSYTLTFDNPTECDILIVGNTNASQYNTIELSGNIPINVGSNSSVGSYNTSSGSKPITSSITGISITYYDPIVIIRYKTKMVNTTSYNGTYNKITKGFNNLFLKSLDNNIYTLNPITTTNTNYGTTTSINSLYKLDFFTNKIVDNIFSSKHKDTTLFITSNNLIYNSGDLIYNNLVSKNTDNEPKLINDIFDNDLINIIRYKNDDGYYLRYSDKVLDNDKNELTFSSIDSNNIKKIEKTNNSTVILTIEGKVYIKGDLNGIIYSEIEEVIPEEIIIDISCGCDHVLFRTANKTLYGLGDNSEGQLGDNTKILNMIIPYEIVIRDNNGNKEEIEEIICENYHSIIKTNIKYILLNNEKYSHDISINNIYKPEKMYPSKYARENYFDKIDGLSPDEYNVENSPYDDGLYTVEYSTYDSSTNNSPHYVFHKPNSSDGSKNAKWLVNQFLDGVYNSSSNSLGGINGDWVSIQMPTKILITKYILVSIYDASYQQEYRCHLPHDYVILGCNDGDGNWETIYTETNTGNGWFNYTYVNTDDSYIKVFKDNDRLTGNKLFNTFALVIKKIGNWISSRNSVAAMAEWEIFGKEEIIPEPFYVTQSPVTEYTVLQTDATNLVAWYKFDDNIDDSTDNGNDLIALSGTVQLVNTQYKIGKSAYFTSDSLKMNTFTFNDKPFAVAFWVYKTEYGFFLTQRKANIINQHLHIGSRSGGYELSFYGNDLKLTTEYTADMNTWVHLVFQIDASKNREIWRNGVRIANDTSGSFLDVDNNDIVIGNRTDTNDFFEGYLDDFRIYDKALTPNEISILANNMVPDYNILTFTYETPTDDIQMAETATGVGGWYHIKHLHKNATQWYPENTEEGRDFFTVADQVFDSHGSFTKPFPDDFDELLFARSDGNGNMDRYVYCLKTDIERIIKYQDWIENMTSIKTQDGSYGLFEGYGMNQTYRNRAPMIISNTDQNNASDYIVYEEHYLTSTKTDEPGPWHAPVANKQYDVFARKSGTGNQTKYELTFDHPTEGDILIVDSIGVEHTSQIIPQTVNINVVSKYDTIKLYPSQYARENYFGKIDGASPDVYNVTGSYDDGSYTIKYSTPYGADYALHYLFHRPNPEPSGGSQDATWLNNEFSNGDYNGGNSLGGISGAWVSIQMPTKILLTKYILVSIYYADHPNVGGLQSEYRCRLPHDYVILGCNDGDGNWETIYTETNTGDGWFNHTYVNTDDSYMKSLTDSDRITGNKLFNTFALVVKKIGNWNASHSSVAAMAEWELFGQELLPSITAQAVSTVNNLTTSGGTPNISSSITGSSISYSSPIVIIRYKNKKEKLPEIDYTETNISYILNNNNNYDVTPTYNPSEFYTERMYPPVRNLTSNSHVISGEAYGNGLYEVSVSTEHVGSQGHKAFNIYTESFFTGAWYQYSSGVYSKDNYIVSDYKGDWLKIKLPYAITLTKYGFKAKLWNNDAAPGKYKIYGSNDDTNWDILVHKTDKITYNLQILQTNDYFEENLNVNQSYQYFALVVNELLGTTRSLLILDEWYIYGKQLLVIRPEPVYKTERSIDGYIVLDCDSTNLVAWYKFDTIPKNQAVLKNYGNGGPIYDATINIASNGINRLYGRNKTYKYHWKANAIDGNFISVPGNILQKLYNNGHTICFWADDGVINDIDSTLIATNSDNTGIYIRLQTPWNDSNIYYDNGDGDSSSIRTTVASGIGENELVFWTFTRENIDSAEMILKIYRNGLIIKAEKHNRLDFTTSSTSSIFIIGYNMSSKNADFVFKNKSLEDFRIYDKALTPYEISLLANNKTELPIVESKHPYNIDKTKRLEYLAEEKTGVKGWRLVRFLPPTSSTWHPTNDDLAGTTAYGTAYDYTNAFSVIFGAFDEMFFSTKNMIYWLWTPKTSVEGEYTDTDGGRLVYKSSNNSSEHNVEWHNRPANTSDPIISVLNNSDANNQCLYAEDSFSDAAHTQLIAGNEGMCVFVRNSTDIITVNNVPNPNYYTLTFTYETTRYPEIDADATNLIAWYKFDAFPTNGATLTNYGSGGTAYDATLNIVSNGIERLPAENVGYKYNWKIDAESGNYISVPPNILESLYANGHTICFWSKDASTIDNDYTVLARPDGTIYPYIRIHSPWSNGIIYYDNGNGTVDYGRLNGASGIGANELVFWAFTRENISSAQMMLKIYKNGVMFLSGTYTRHDFTNVLSSSIFYIGYNTSGEFIFKNKSLEDFRIYNKALSASEIQDLYTQYNQTPYTLTFNNPTKCDILIVGGGGAAGTGIGGGGGAGGVVYIQDYQFNSDTNYKIKVGNGGINTGIQYRVEGSGHSKRGVSGYDSGIYNYDNTNIIYTDNGANFPLIGYGGGGGGAYSGNTYTEIEPASGGSSGGIGCRNASDITMSSAVVATQGNTYWNGTAFVPGGYLGGNIGRAEWASAGGGGAGGAGQSAPDANNGGDGGAGIVNDITGIQRGYAGGGGGSTDSSTSTNMGRGGSVIIDGVTIYLGGDGIPYGTADNEPGGDGLIHTGSGGGGGGWSDPAELPGNGGSGVVIIRYRDEYKNNVETTGTLSVKKTSKEKILYTKYNDLIYSFKDKNIITNILTPIIYSDERLYPPIRNLSSASHTITGQLYGNGTYNINGSYYYDRSSTHEHFRAFNETTESAAFQLGQYDAGNYIGTNNNIEKGYFGDYLTIELPIKIKLTKYRFKQRDPTNYGHRAPGQYKIYGSNDNMNWTVLVNKSSTIGYTSGEYEDDNIDINESYKHYALVVNKTVGSNGDMLDFDDWYIYGKELLYLKGNIPGTTDYKTLTFTYDATNRFVFREDESPYGWQEAYDEAIVNGRRMPTKSELLDYLSSLGNQPLYTGDVWIYVQADNAIGKDAVQVGDADYHFVGKSHYDSFSNTSFFSDQTIAPLKRYCEIKDQTSYTLTFDNPAECDILIVGGGGGGDRQIGGGGGGGAVLYAQKIQIPADTYTVKVGNGGNQNQNGFQSEAFGATCLGGGSTTHVAWNTGNAGNSGGSGSGGSSNGTYAGGGVGSSIQGTFLQTHKLSNGSIILYNGNIGGSASIQTGEVSSGGGGGAGTAGNNGTDATITTISQYQSNGYPAKGGDGVQINIDGNNYYWGGGGGGGSYAVMAGQGGLGGGGAGGQYSDVYIQSGGTGGINLGQNGGTNGIGSGGDGGEGTGGGGGGGGYGNGQGGKGGSGIVIIRYRETRIDKSDIEDVYVNNNNVFFKKSNGDIINENDDILYTHNDSLTINKGIIDSSDNLLLSYKNNDVKIDPDIEYQKEWIYTNYATYYMGNVAIGKTTATDKLDISGTLSTNYGKQFKITHPLDSNLWLYHSSIECPRNDNIYRGEAIIKNGYVEVNIDKECNTTGGMIEGTFKKLNKNVQLFLQNNDTFDNVKGNINNNIIKIYCANKNKDIKVNWIVIGERDDEEIKKLEITDINGCLVCEHLLS